MWTNRYIHGLVVVLLLTGNLGAQTPEKPTKDGKAKPPSKKQIADWVRQLGAGDFSDREEASRKLWKAGRHAEDALKKALQSDDAEVRRRSQELLNKFRWGIYPDTPRAIVALINEYRVSDSNGKQQVIRKMFQAGPAGIRTLLKIVTAEKDERFKQAVFAQLANELGRAMPAVLAKGDFKALESLLEIGLVQDFDNGVCNYTAYWYLRGKVDERIAHHKALAARSAHPQREALLLAYLHRARGDLASALQWAKKAGDTREAQTLTEALLFEMADWKILANRKTIVQPNTDSERLAWRASYHRLAGNQDAFARAVQALRDHGKRADISSWERFNAAKGLILNDHPKDAFPLFLKSNREQVVFDILAKQLKMKEAFAVVDKARVNGSRDLPALELAQARVLATLGATDRARKLFDQYAAKITPGVDASWFETLIETENRVGMREQAFAHAARVLAVSNDRGWPGRLFGELYGDRGEVAEQLWGLLRLQMPREDTASAIKRLRALMSGKAKEKEITALVAVANREKREAKPSELIRRQAVLAEAAQRAGHKTIAQQLWKKVIDSTQPTTLPEGEQKEWAIATSQALLRLGDWYASRKQWAKAADHYHLSWKRDSSQPLPLYLSGQALVRIGQAPAGKQRMDHAHWLPLGSGPGRRMFLQALAKRGMKEGVLRETDLLLRVTEPASFYVSLALRIRGSQALDKKDYAQAAKGHVQSMLFCQNSSVYFLRAGAYVSVPAMVHRIQAQGSLARGKVEEANKHIELCRQLLPASVDLVVSMVPALEKRGQKKEASALFESTMKAYEDLCTQYPRCAWAHNSAAWMGATCRRNLDQALKHSQEAVKLSPDNPAYLDTLAEVHFQRGDKDKAIATQNKVIKLDPTKAYFRKQLKRIEAGDPSAPLPEEHGL